ncbi:hypothetical protein BJ165DRAFT_1461202 [Panaeolus papilionaceus]|nr:hypothetical protein BJ165DRAFT_1461202 [Panaeolus papilionaceus]
MFSKLAVVFAIAFGALSVSAGGTYTDGNGIQYSCNTGPVQCCNTMQKFGRVQQCLSPYLLREELPKYLFFTSQNAIDIDGAKCNICIPADQLVGVNCSPITVGL